MKTVVWTVAVIVWEKRAVRLQNRHRQFFPGDDVSEMMVVDDEHVTL